MLQNNIAQQSSLLSRLSDSQLSQELSSPSGMAPQYLVMSEMQKRQQMRSGGGGGAKPPIKQQMLANSAVGPSPTMPEAASPANIQSPPVPAGQGMVGNNIAPQGGIPALAQMSRVAGSPIARPVGYDQALPPTYSQGGIVGAMRFAAGDEIPDVGDDGTVAPAVTTGHRQVPTTPVVVPQTDFSPYAVPATDNSNFGIFDKVGPSGLSANNVMGYGAGAYRALMPYMGDAKSPQSIGTNSADALDAMGGKDSFTKPYDPAIAMYRQQAAAQNPISTALMKAGAAMMSAPNGTLLSGLGVGLNSGVDAYGAAQAQQRAIQDKLVQAQMAQGNALVGGRERAVQTGVQLGQQQNNAWDNQANRTMQLVNHAIQVPQTNYTTQQSNDQFSVESALKRQALGIQSGQLSLDHDKLAAQIKNQDLNDVDNHGQAAYKQAYTDWFGKQGINISEATPAQMVEADATAKQRQLDVENQIRKNRGLPILEPTPPISSVKVRKFNPATGKIE